MYGGHQKLARPSQTFAVKISSGGLLTIHRTAAWRASWSQYFSAYLIYPVLTLFHVLHVKESTCEESFDDPANSPFLFTGAV